MQGERRDPEAAARHWMDCWVRGLNGEEAAQAEVLARLHPDVSAYMPPMGRVGGPYPDRETTEGLFRYVFGAFSSKSAPLRVTTDAVLVDGDSVAFLQHNEGAPMPDGTPYRPTIVIVLTMKDGLLWRYQEFFGARWTPEMARFPWEGIGPAA